MILKNGNVFLDNKFTKCDVVINDGKVTYVGTADDSVSIDCEGKYIIPGLVDIHTHGCIGYDFSSALPAEIIEMRKYYLNNGITSVFATTVTMSNDDIRKAVENINSASYAVENCADILGVNIEGPYLSPKKCGAHDISLLKEPDIDFISSLGSIVKIVDLAPEYEASMDFIKGFNGKCSIAHTDCDYATAMAAINAGADHITHIFNAMNGIHHRKPGVIGAFFDSDSYAEIICDGIHIDPAILRMMFNARADRLVVISDSMAATGLSDGQYLLGKLNVTVENAVATLDDGTLAGSTMNVYNMMKKLISFGIDIETAVKCVTSVPADSVGIGDRAGYIKQGRDADMVIVDPDMNITNVIFKGNPVK